MGAVLPVAAVSAVQFVLAGVWYGPIFGETFLALAYRYKQPLGPVPLGVIGSIAGSLLMNSILYFVLQLARTPSPDEAIKIGVALALLPAGATLTHHFWENRPLKLYFLHEAMHTVALGLNAYLLRRFFL